MKNTSTGMRNTLSMMLATVGLNIVNPLKMLKATESMESLNNSGTPKSRNTLSQKKRRIKARQNNVHIKRGGARRHSNMSKT